MLSARRVIIRTMGKNDGATRQAVTRMAALLAIGVLWSCLSTASALAAPPFANKVSAPPWPAKLQVGSNLTAEPAPLLGNFDGDAEFWNLFYAAAAGIGANTKVPVDGWLTGVYVRGFAVSGDTPGPGGSQPFRVGVEQELPSGQLQVVSTSNPPFQLPGTSGTYYYWIGPPYTGFRMPLKKDEYVSFDTRGGTFAVFGSVPGASSASTVGKGQEQNAGVIWTGTPHPGVELLMQGIEQPKVPTAKLEAASTPLGKALALEQEAEGSKRGTARAKLRSSIAQLKAAAALVHQAGEAKEGEIGHDTEVSIEHYLGEAVSQDKAARSAKRDQDRNARIRLAIEAKHKALSDIGKAKSLARHMLP
jgi:hypothetical protein